MAWSAFVCSMRSFLTLTRQVYIHLLSSLLSLLYMTLSAELLLQLLEDDRYRCIEKIKTISSTYMAASGLNPRDQGKSEGYLLNALVDFALSMKDALEDVNTHSFNNFKMRIGILVVCIGYILIKIVIFIQE